MAQNPPPQSKRPRPERRQKWASVDEQPTVERSLGKAGSRRSNPDPMSATGSLIPFRLLTAVATWRPISHSSIGFRESVAPLEAGL
jgi:hypothetical protein